MAGCTGGCHLLPGVKRRCTGFLRFMTFPWNGQVLHATSEQILKDDYMVWAGNMFLQELYLALFWASVAVSVLAFLIFRFLRRLGEKQAQDERMGAVS